MNKPTGILYIEPEAIVIAFSKEEREKYKKQGYVFINRIGRYSPSHIGEINEKIK